MLLIKNGYVKTMAGPDIPGGSVLIGDDGKILQAGTKIDVPENATVIDAEGSLVTPGCVDAHCHIGLEGTAVRWEGIDINESSDPITPQLRAIDAFNPIDESLTDALEGGVTTACTGPGSANVVGGSFVAVKLAGRRVDDMIVKFPLAMKCAFGENPKGSYGQNGKKAPILGRVCMDQTVVDVTDIEDVSENDTVTIFGDELTISLLAEKTNTIPYEILTGVSARVKRVYYQE
jgi:imidazolonepropionase-like amidohydrolase